jgi:hypothetical protein
MEHRLHLLESFAARGSDGNRYKVCAYERLVLVPGAADQWEPTGELVYRLDDARPVEVNREAVMSVAGCGIVLTALRD